MPMTRDELVKEMSIWEECSDNMQELLERMNEEINSLVRLCKAMDTDVIRLNKVVGEYESNTRRD